jgi:hypothetical protein
LYAKSTQKIAEPFRLSLTARILKWDHSFKLGKQNKLKDREVNRFFSPTPAFLAVINEYSQVLEYVRILYV